mmetsp:Transcript_35233/g.70456  ORF Transcript_35233/g.70456 Transcript_35233/m.70456 type:complete len:214 (+) Transcript_35233:593-1234(+)
MRTTVAGRAWSAGSRLSAMSLATRARSLRWPRTPMMGRSWLVMPRKSQAHWSSTRRANLFASTTSRPLTSCGAPWYMPTRPSLSDTSRTICPSTARSLFVNVHHLAWGCALTNSLAPGRTSRWITDLNAFLRSKLSQYSLNSFLMAAGTLEGTKLGSWESSSFHHSTHLITSSTSLVPSPTSFVWSTSHTRCSSESPGYWKAAPLAAGTGRAP